VSSRVIEGIVYDTDAATLVATFPGLRFVHTLQEFSNFEINPGEYWHILSSDIYVTPSGTWFIVNRDVRGGLIERGTTREFFYPISADTAFHVLQGMNAIDIIRKWFPNWIRNA